MADENDARIQKAYDIHPEGMVFPVSCIKNEGLEPIINSLAPGHTGIILGSSGVGKSTLLNTLLGSPEQATREIRISDGSGRHTTTSRQMFLLPQGGLLIDTPGLREIQIWADESLLPEVFPDIADLASSCRFKDCQHQSEPHCAVQEAIKNETLAPARYKNYLKLQKELAYLKRKQNPEDRANSKRRWKKINKELRQQLNQKGKGRPLK